MSKTDKPKTKPLTEAERSYLKRLNQEASDALQRHQEAQQRLIQCVAFLREQHDAPEDKWALTNLETGFERIPEKPKRKEKDGDTD